MSSHICQTGGALVLPNLHVLTEASHDLPCLGAV